MITGVVFMKKFVVSMITVSGLLFGLTSNVFADGDEDTPFTEVNDFNEQNETQSLGKEYARAFDCKCTTNNRFTYEPWTEEGGYQWIQDQGEKGYVRDANSSGPVLGVVLRDTIIEFSDGGYTAKIRFQGDTHQNNASYVKGIQYVLNCLGYNAGAVDGIFGEQTTDAVIAFQDRRGLTVDGIVGKTTYYELSRASY